MTKRAEVTDEQVLRAARVLADSGMSNWGVTINLMRKALEAALNPPPEPEIQVTEEQIAAGRLELKLSVTSHQHVGWGIHGTYQEIVTPHDEQVKRAYRAMRRLEKPHPWSVGTPWHSHRRSGDEPFPRIHCRKDDP